jgi:hypothetical protein
MSRIVLYLTEPASDVNAHVRMGRAMCLLMDLHMRGMSVRNYSTEARAHMDYALESPDMIPAGACQQYEIDTGEEDNGMPGYCVSAQQIAIDRKSLE